MQFVIYSLSSIQREIEVCPSVNLHTFYSSEADGQNVLGNPKSVERTQLIQTSNVKGTSFSQLSWSHEEFNASTMPWIPN